MGYHKMLTLGRCPRCGTGLQTDGEDIYCLHLGLSCEYMTAVDLDSDVPVQLEVQHHFRTDPPAESILERIRQRKARQPR